MLSAHTQKRRDGYIWWMTGTDEWFFSFFALSVWNRALKAFWEGCSPLQGFPLEWPININMVS